MSSFPAIAELLPHAGGMRLLERVLAHGPDGTVCEARVARSALFRRPDGGVPTWVSLEWMAQCAGVHGALAARARGERLERGFLVGSRSSLFHAPRLPEGPLRVHAAPGRETGGLHAFTCRVVALEGELLAEARLGVFIPRDAVVPAPPAPGASGSA